jgi:DNA phosphorothioation-dependent restriction protein DptH
MSNGLNKTFLVTLAQVFEDEISKIRGKHYVRVENVDPVHAPQVIPILREVLKKSDESLSASDKRHFSVGVLSKDSNANNEIRIDDAIRIRNTEGESLFLLVPAMFDVPGSLNNSGDTIDLDASFARLIEIFLTQLAESDVSTLVANLNRELRNRQKANWAALLAELVEQPTLETFGRGLWRVGLVPDLGFKDLSDRMSLNFRAVKAISKPRKPESVDERLNSAGVRSGEERNGLKQFLGSVLMENPGSWCGEITRSFLDSLSFEKWPLADSSGSDISRLDITSFRKKDGHVTPRCKLKELIGDELLPESDESSDHMANNPLYCEVGIDAVSGEAKMPATVVVDWKTDPSNAEPFEWRVDVILIPELRDVDTSPIATRPVKGDKRTAKLSIFADEDDLQFGRLFCISVTGVNEDGEEVYFVRNPSEVVSAESEEFEIRLIGVDDGDGPIGKPRSATAISPAEGYLSVVVGGSSNPVEVFDYDDSGRVISITYVAPNDDLKLVSTEVRRVRIVPLFIELERELFADTASGMIFEATSVYGESIKSSEIVRRKVTLPDSVSSARQAFLSELRSESRLQDNRALIETVDWDDEIYALALDYVSAYNSALDNPGDFDTKDLIEIETLKFNIDSPGGVSEAVVVLSMHPLRILWLAEYDRKVRKWANEYAHLRNIEKRAVIDLEIVRRIQPSNLPFVMPLESGKFCVYLDEIAFGCGLYLPLDGKDVQKSARMVEAVLATQGSNLVSATRADLLEKRIRSFLDSHSYNEALSLIAVNPGSGEILSSALSKFLRPDPDEERQLLDFRMEIKIYGNDLPFSKPVNDLQELQETMRSVHPIGTVNHLMPPFGITVRDRDQLEIDEDGAHIAIAQDLSMGELVSFDPEMHRVPGLGGLLTGTHTVKIESGLESKWVTLPSLAPFQNSVLTRCHRSFLDAIRRNYGFLTTGLGVAVGLNAATKNAIRALHTRSDWVITIDRFIGLDWYENSESAGLDGAYVLDYTPDFVEGMGERLTVTTKHRVEIVGILERAMDELGFRLVGTESLILDNLALLSGRLALRLLDNNSFAAEAVSLAVVIQHLKVNGELNGKFLIPVDAHHEIFGTKSQGIGESGRRCDMLIVGFDESGLSIGCVEVKARNRAVVPIRLARDIRDQLLNTQEILMDRFFGDDPNRIDRELQVAHFASVMHHYVDRAVMHNSLTPDEANSYHEKIDRIGEFTTNISLSGYVVSLGADEAGFQDQIDGIPIILITNDLMNEAGFSTVIEEHTRSESFQLTPSISVKTDMPMPSMGKDKQSELVKKSSKDGDPLISALTGETENSIESIRKKSEALPNLDKESSPSNVVKSEKSSSVSSKKPSIEVPMNIAANPKSAAVVLGKDSVGTSVEHKVSTQGSPHAVIIGIPGQGKSVTTRRIINGFSEAGLPSLVFDFHGDMAANPPEGARVYDVRENGLGFSPFEIDGNRQRDVNETSMAVSEIVEFVCELGEIQRQHVYRGIIKAFEDLGWVNDVQGTRLPTIAEFANAVEFVEQGARGKNARGRLLPLTDFGLFAEEANEAFDPTGGGKGLIIDLSDVQLDSVKKAASSFVLRKVYRDMFTWDQDSTMKLNIVLDEAHRMLLDKTLPKLLKEGRKFGVSVLAASQSMADFSKQVIDNVGTKIVFRTNYPDSKTAANLIRGRDGKDLSKNIEQLGVGEAYVSTPTLAMARLVKMYDDLRVD